jgi:uncharacterized protein YprB with RNaseH-like and TPR domain
MNLAVVDLECTSLKSDQGFLLCGGIKPIGKEGEVYGLRDVGLGTSRYALDSRLVRRLIERMNEFDGWVTWNGLMFDLPWLDDRAMICGLDPPARRFARGLDMMWMARQGKSTFTSSRLDWVAKSLKCPIEKTALNMNTWKDAEAEAIRRFKGGSESYQYIVEHCAADLGVTEFVYEKLKPRIMNVGRR